MELELEWNNNNLKINKMKNLTYEELVSIDGGIWGAPDVSSDSVVNGAYSVGWHVGHAIGQTIKDIKSIFS